jgi:hypothetical protein
MEWLNPKKMIYSRVYRRNLLDKLPNSEDIINWLYKKFIRYWSLLGLVIYLTIFNSTNQISFGLDGFDFSEIGWAHFINIFKVPLSFIGLGIPIYGIILTMHRSQQNEKQLELFRINVNFNNYFKHKDEFVKRMTPYFESLGGWRDYTDEDKLRTLYEKWYGSDFKTDFKISAPINHVVHELFDSLNTLYTGKHRVHIETIRHLIKILGFENKVRLVSLTNFAESPKHIARDIQNVIKVCDTIFKFSNEDGPLNPLTNGY